VVGALVRSGRQVRAFDIASDVEQLAGAGVADVMVGDLLDPADLHRAVEVSASSSTSDSHAPREVEMGHGVVSAARHAGVEHFVQFFGHPPQLELLLNHQASSKWNGACSCPDAIHHSPAHALHAEHRCGQVVAERVLSQPYSLDTRLTMWTWKTWPSGRQVVGDPHHHYATYELCVGLP